MNVSPLRLVDSPLAAGLGVVLRHYWRGGLIGRFKRDLFTGLSLHRSCAMTAWRHCEARSSLNSVAAEQVAGVDLRFHIAKRGRLAVGDDDVADAFEFI